MTLIVCSALVVFLKTTMKKTGKDMRNVSEGCAHLVLVWRKILFVSLVRDRTTVLFIVYILCICNFLSFVTILCVFCANYSPPQIRNTCVPKWGGEAFMKMNFTYPFLFVMYDVRTTAVSSLIK
jgi:hypothetical protein